jgi:replicative DNA helicase
VIPIELYDTNLELRTLACICNSTGSTGVSYLMSRLNQEHFHYEPCKTVYKRIIKLFQSRGDVPSYHELEEDPILDEEFRDILRSNEYKTRKLKDESNARIPFEKLEKFRKIREVFYLSKSTIEALKKSSVDIDKILQTMGDTLAVARSTVQHQDQLVHIGQGNNSSAVVKEVLYGESAPTIPTGFKTFDQKNGGFFKPAVAILSSNSSGGKSVAALQMAVNMYRAGFSTCVLSLEMSKEQYMSRFLSNISGVNATKIFLKSTSDLEKKKIKDAYKEFVLFGKKKGVRWTILAPDSGMSFDQLLMTCKPFGYDVITVD